MAVSDVSDKCLEYETHFRTIIHLDMDCYYAQVEMIKNPLLRTVPLGVQQKNIVVTSNYIAREYGVTKCMPVVDAKKLCPNLTLVCGEDLQDYRKMSNKVTAILQKFTSQVERLGLDENFLDVTELVNERIQKSSESDFIEGFIYSGSGELEKCICGCHNRLRVGAFLANEIRNSIKKELGLTCCAGISYNKLLSKLVGSKNKPNMQTVLSPCSVGDLLSSLDSLQSIPGIGVRTAEILRGINITTVSDLQNCKFNIIENVLGVENSKRLKALCFGKDDSPVAVTRKPHSIGLEDSCEALSVKSQVEEKLHVLLKRLLELQNEDGRMPLAIKLILRKKDNKNNFIRETKQCSLPSSLFAQSENNLSTRPGGYEKILFSVMRLFNRLVDITKPFHITLVGLAFIKFQERKTGHYSIASYLMKNISVQSITSFKNVLGESPPSPMDLSKNETDISTDNSDTDTEPSPKKAKVGLLMAKRSCIHFGEVSSPSKLNVSRLRLNSIDKDSASEHCTEIALESCSNDIRNISCWKKSIVSKRNNSIGAIIITNK